MLDKLCPNLSILTKVCLAIPVGTAFVECSFSHVKMIKMRLRNRLGEVKPRSQALRNCAEDAESLVTTEYFWWSRVNLIHYGYDGNLCIRDNYSHE